MNNYFKKQSGYFWFQCILGFVIVVIVICGYISSKQPYHIDRDETILFIDSSKQLTPEQFQGRTEYLTQILVEHELGYSNNSMARSSERMQTRLSYIALIAALFFALQTIQRKKIKIIHFAALCLTLLFYFYDIHIVDLGFREEQTKNLLDNSIIKLNEMPIEDSTYYFFSYKKVDDYNKSMSINSHLRKLFSILSPDIAQIAFYLVPFFVFNFVSIMFYWRAEKLLKN